MVSHTEEMDTDMQEICYFSLHYVWIMEISLISIRDVPTFYEILKNIESLEMQEIVSVLVRQ